MENTPFEFKSRLVLTELLGRRAATLPELVEGIRSVPLSSIYHHTHRFLQQHHFLSPEPPNDFAYWVTNMLNDEIAGEKLASIDVMQFLKLSDLRQRFLTLLEDYLRTANNVNRQSPEGEEFHFMSSRIFVVPTGKIARTVEEFREVLKAVSIHSIYFHMFEAKLRLEKGDNDFSIWLRSAGKEREAEQISRLDPYTFTLEGLRERLLKIINNGTS
ncbi:MAG: DUF5752 family protein [Bacteroidetes bacterium]|nr:DUF5752 family protein [Bacteroidota bacterium]